MKTLFTDLDNTLVYPGSRIGGKDNTVMVELLNGEPLSYMTISSYVKLASLSGNTDIRVVPITTRTIEQFNRIRIPATEFAITGNGSNLLINGSKDKPWEDETMSYKDSCIGELNSIYNVLKKRYPDSGSVRWRDDAFICGKFDNPAVVKTSLERMAEADNVAIYTQGSKLYVMPKELNKGNAIARFMKRFDAGITISAGDEVLDFPMAKQTGTFITSNRECSYSNVVYSNSVVFADEVLDYVMSM